MICKAISAFLLIGMLGALSCKHEPGPVPKAASGNFPAEVSAIFVNKCATAGCHNAASHENAGGLLLDSWEHLFNGGNNGAVIVPYSVDYSPLLYFINTDSTLGPVATPHMPLNGTPLTKDEYLTIRNWIANGAPDKNGDIPFASAPESRQKVYTIHQGCDMVAVIDVEKNVVMRYISIGDKPYGESPTYVQVAPDGQSAYVSFWYSSKIFKIDTRTDQVVASPDLGESFWNVLHISQDGRKLLMTNGDNYSLVLVDLVNWKVQTLTNGNEFIKPHGLASNASFDTFYVTGMVGNTLYKFAQGYNKKISIDGHPTTSSSSAVTPDPYQVIMSPDFSKYFISCANSNEVRVMDSRTDTLIKIIPVGRQPQSFAISNKKPWLFLTCAEDITSQPGMKGSVYVINYNTLEVVQKVEGKFHQPHGITVSDKENTFYIFSRNQTVDGPAPHHQGPCSGRNGYYSIYDINTLAPATTKRHEVLVDPFISDVRFK